VVGHAPRDRYRRRRSRRDPGDEPADRRYGADDPDAWLWENTLVRIDAGSASHETF